MEKSCRKCAPKATRKAHFNFGKQPKTAIACKKLFYTCDILKKGHQKTFKVNFIFLSNAVLFNGKD